MHLLGLDVGTTGCKAVVFDAQGEVKGHGFHEYDVICREPGMAEQDAERVWDLARGVLREAVVRSGVRDLKALSVSVQGDAIIPVQKDFHALHPAVLGMDYRSQRQARECAEKCGDFELFQRTGMRAHPINSLTKVLLLRELAPAVFAQTWKFVTYADFVLGKLGAEAVLDHTMASRTMAFDLADRRWNSDILTKVGLAESLFSRAVPSGTPVGRIRPLLARELGLPTDLLLVAGGHDQPCAALGAGVIREGLGVVSTGTAEVLATAFDHPTLTRPMFESFYPCTLHAKAGMYFTFSLNHVGGLLLRWYRDNFAGGEVADAARQGAQVYGIIDARLPRGPSPVMVLPHWNGSGTPRCDLEAKGAILGLTTATTRHDVAKAILEGLCFELLINLRTMEQCGIEVHELAAVGGGARSERWLQLKADILQRPVRTLRCRESACLGAALLAGTAAGVFASLDEAVRQTVAWDREFVPQHPSSEQYQVRFATYQKLYPALRLLNAELSLPPSSAQNLAI
jgi:xylulokinase